MILSIKSKSETSKPRLKLILAIIIGLLILRIPYLGVITLFLKHEPDWLYPTYSILTYLLTAILIWYEKEDLPYFHIDKTTLVLLFVFRTILIYDVIKPNIFSYVKYTSFWLISITLFFALQTRSPKMENVNIKKALLWISFSFLIGIIMVILPRLVITVLFYKPLSIAIFSLPNTYIQFFSAFIYYMGTGSVDEEPVFRGFLWGYLRKTGWNEKWIWLFQAGLFWLAHMKYFGRVSFWFEIPITGLVLGLIAWRSRSITASMIAHASMNAMGILVAYIF